MTGSAPAGEDVAQHLPPAGSGWMLRFYDPMSEAFGIDPDDASLSRARSKADARGLEVQVERQHPLNPAASQ